MRNLFTKGPKVLYRVTGAERAALDAKLREIVAAQGAYRQLVQFIAEREHLKSCIFDEATATFYEQPAPAAQNGKGDPAPAPQSGR